MSFDRWRSRLAGEKVVTYLQPDVEDEGYYRKPITEPKLAANGQRNGQKRIIGWEPVAYFIDRGKLCGVIGDRDMAINEVTDESLWSWVVRYPITEELYRAVAERGQPWPDLAQIADAGMTHPDPVTESTGTVVPAANREVSKSDNNPPEELPPEVQHAQAIDTAIGAAPTKVSSEAEAAVALGSKNRIAELRLAADKAGKAVYEPPFKEYKRLYGLWNPMTARAVKKEGEIQTAVLTFRESERKRLAKIEAVRLEAIRNAEAEAERIAQRAIAAGKPEPAPAPAPEPAPLAQPAKITPTYGSRGLRETMKKFAQIEDEPLVYQHFKGGADLTELLLKLAQAEVNAGRDVPGVSVREGLV